MESLQVTPDKPAPIDAREKRSNRKTQSISVTRFEMVKSGFIDQPLAKK
jgi:hypothetical protein